MKTRLKFYRLLMVVGSSLIALLLAEIGGRIVFPPAPSIRFQQDIDELQGMKLDDAANMIQNDPELFWRLKPNKQLPDELWPFFGVISNGQGLREDRNIPLDKPAGGIRILFLGDSCTFGYGVAHDQTFVKVAESLLEAIVSGPVECINAGVPGYTLFQGYRYLVTEGLRYQPDLVVLNFGWNDYGQWDDRSDAEHYAHMLAAQPPKPLRKSRICQLLWSFKQRPSPPRANSGKQPRLSPVEFAETLGEIHSLLGERRIALLILVWPMRLNTVLETAAGRTSLQMEMLAFGQNYTLSTSSPVGGVLDLIPLGRELVRENGPEAIYFDQGHVTPIGHRAIGEAIAGHLRPWVEAEWQNE